jgi:hypothetical protein
VARPLTFALGLVGVAALLTAAVGCGSSINPGGGPVDGAAMNPDVPATIFGGESDADVDADVASCTDIKASSYDLSCTSDTDCILVGGFGNSCTVCLNCPRAPINKASEQQYWADVGKAAAGALACFCTTPPIYCCVRGACQMNDVCESPTWLTNVDAGLAVADAASDEAGADSGTVDAADASAE